MKKAKVWIAALVLVAGVGAYVAQAPASAEPLRKAVTLCHVAPGNPKAKPVTITVPPQAVPAHLGHGDSLDACP